MRLPHLLVLLAASGCGGIVAGGDAGVDSGSDAAVDAPQPDCACGGAQYCKHDATCGSTSGTCVARPTSCPDLYAPVCGYDGKAYPNACTANAAGVDVSPQGGCSPPAGWVVCGAGMCDATTSYCQSAGNDVAGPNEPCAFYSCVALPPSCQSTKDCSCFDGSVPCSSTCTYDGNGFQVVCPGG